MPIRKQDTWKTATVFASAICLGLILSGSAMAEAATTAATKTQVSAGQQGALTLTLEVESTAGAVMIAVYADAQSYAGGAPAAARRVPLSATSMSVTFDGLPFGEYAIKAYHDRDGNGELTTNPFGSPIEPFAFSNGAKAHYGPPSFDEAAFELSAPTATGVLSFLP